MGPKSSDSNHSTSGITIVLKLASSVYGDSNNDTSTTLESTHSNTEY